MNRLLTSLVSLALALPALAVDLTNNLSNVSGGAETVSGNRILCASFTNTTGSHSITSATLKLGATAAGGAVLQVYTNNGLEPGTLVGTLAGPASYTTAISDTTFTSNAGIALTSGATYWLVLRASTGQFQWAWSSVNNGTGTGFTDTWGSSEDAGLSWYTIDSYPTQFSVTIDGCNAPVVSTNPVSLTRSCGATASFTASASGTGTVSYVWKKGTTTLANGGRISGANTATLTITGVTAADAGSYTAVASNACGSATTTAATLTVTNCCGSADFNGDGDIGTDQDIEAFFACLAGNCCAECGTADFNADGDIGTDQDIEAFFRVLAGGSC